MDPISITSIVLTTAKICLATTKSLYDLRERYQDAPIILISICSETSIIAASLAQIQSLIAQHQAAGASSPLQWHADMPLRDVLDQALTGCKVVFSCLDLEVQRIVDGEEGGPAGAGWRSRARLMWNETRLKELLGALRGQQTAIGLVIQLFQVNTLGDIRQMLRDKQETMQAAAAMTASLRSANPSIRVAHSIYEAEDREGRRGDEGAVSVVAPSDIEFDFDDEVVSGRAYRRLLAQARAGVTNNIAGGGEPSLAVIVEAAPTPTAANTANRLVGQIRRRPVPTEDPVEQLSDTLSETLAVVGTPGQSPGLPQLEPGASTAVARGKRAVFVAPLPPRFSWAQRCERPECDEPIATRHSYNRDYRVVQVAWRRHFHKECFRCWLCKTSIVNEYYSHQGSFLCRIDYFQMLGVCLGCGGSVEDYDNCREVTLEWGGRAKFHAVHVFSDCCGLVFEAGDPVHHREGKFYCRRHYCLSCGGPICLSDETIGCEPGADNSPAGYIHAGCYQVYSIRCARKQGG